MAYPDKINALVDVSADETLAAGGHAARHNDVNDALEEVRDVLGGGQPIVPTDTIALHLRQTGAIGIRMERSDNSSARPFFRFEKGRGSISSQTVVQDDDRLGAIFFLGYSGAAADFLTAAAIEAEVDGEPDTAGDTSDMPGRLLFLTTPNGSNSASERMRINNAGAVLIGTTTPGSAGAGDLVVNGGVFLGGTAAGNELDDYEEGTWTPTFINITIGNGTIGTCTYTKVGRIVSVTFTLDWGSTSSFTGNPPTINLPFAASKVSMVPVYVNDTGNRAYTFLSRIGAGVPNNQVNLYYIGVNGRIELVGNSNPFTWVAGDDIRFNLVYETT